jgi:hypothetical protein
MMVATDLFLFLFLLFQILPFCTKKIAYTHVHGKLFENFTQNHISSIIIPSAKYKEIHASFNIVEKRKEDRVEE